MTLPTYFVDDVAVAARAIETPGASFANGVNIGGSNAPGIGINVLGGAVVGTPDQFTLLDQFGNARDAQISQSIGGLPYVDRGTVPYPGSGGTPGTTPDATLAYGTAPTQAAKDADSALDGTITPDGAPSLLDVAVGWVAKI